MLISLIFTAISENRKASKAGTRTWNGKNYGENIINYNYYYTIIIIIMITKKLMVRKVGTRTWKRNKNWGEITNDHYYYYKK